MFNGSASVARSTAFTGSVVSKLISTSIWIKIVTFVGGDYITTFGADYFRVVLDGTDELRISGKNAAGDVILNAVTTDANLVTGTWYNILISIDLASSSNRNIYINDIAPSITWTTYTNDTMDFTKTPFTIAGDSSNNNRINAAFQDFWLLDDTYIDFSVTANRRDFISASGKPVMPGVGGVRPLNGTDPRIFIVSQSNFDDDISSPSQDLTNQASGQTDEGTSPSD